MIKKIVITKGRSTALSSFSVYVSCVVLGSFSSCKVLYVVFPATVITYSHQLLMADGGTIASGKHSYTLNAVK